MKDKLYLCLMAALISTAPTLAEACTGGQPLPLVQVDVHFGMLPEIGLGQALSANDCVGFPVGTPFHGEVVFSNRQFKYRPDGNFWKSGLDIVAYEVTDVNGSVSHGEIALVAMRTGESPVIEENFETDLGLLEVSAGAEKMVVRTQDAIAGIFSLIFNTDETPISASATAVDRPTGFGSIGKIVLDPPPPPPDDPGRSSNRILTPFILDSMLAVDLLQDVDRYAFMRLRWLANRKHTGWFPIPSDPFELGHIIWGVDGVATGHAFVDGVLVADLPKLEIGGSQSHFKARLEIDGSEPALLDGMRLDNVLFHEFYGADGTKNIPERLTGFENGDDDLIGIDQNLDSSAEVSTAGALSGNLGIELPLAPWRSSVLGATVIEENDLSLRFRFDSTDVKYGEGAVAIALLYGDDGSVVGVVQLDEFRAGQMIRLAAFNDDGSGAGDGWKSLPAGAHTLELHAEVASEIDSNDGWIRLEIDGVEISRIEGLSNHDRPIAKWAVGTEWLRQGVGGTLSIDELAVWR